MVPSRLASAELGGGWGRNRIQQKGIHFALLVYVLHQTIAVSSDATFPGAHLGKEGDAARGLPIGTGAMESL